MSDAGRKRGAGGEGGVYSSGGGSGGSGGSGIRGSGAAPSDAMNAKRAKQVAPRLARADSSTSNGHPSAIIAPLCTYPAVEAQGCPHTMVRG